MSCLAIAQPGKNPDVDSALVELASQVSAGTPLYCFSTRQKPGWVGAGDSDEISPALQSVLPQVRWVEVESKEFQELFSIESPKPEATV